MVTNIITAAFSSSTITYTKPAYQYDYGMILKFSGIDLPQAYEVHFSNTEFCGESISQIGDESGVTIPDEMFLSGSPIYAWTFLHTGLDDGETVYKTVISINKRAQPSDIEPTPVQQDVITQAIAALNTAVEQTAADVVAAGESAQAAAGSAEAAGQAKDDAVEAKDKAVEAKNAAETAQGKAEDAQRAAEQAAGSVLGLNADATVDANVGTPSVSVSVTTESDHKKMSFAFHNLKGVQGDPGDTGVGISSVVLNADYTLTINLTNGTSYTTTSIRGEVGATPNLTIGTVSTLPEGSQATATITGTDEEPILNLGIPVGDTGDPGISPVITVTEISGGHNVEITDAQGTQDFDVMDGEVSEEELETALIDKADVITSSASGDIVTIADGANNLPVKDLSVSLLPVQNLNGQDAPYPPGGGANKWDEVWEVGAYNTSNGNPLSSDTQIRSKNLFPVTPSVQYRVVVGSGAMWAFFYDSNQTLLTDLTIEGVSKSGNAFAVSGKVFTMPENASYMKFYMTAAYGATYQNDIAVNYPSTVTTYSPYSNVCPVSGWTGVEVTRTGENLYGGQSLANSIVNAVNNPSNTYTGEDTTGKYVTFAAGSTINNKVFAQNFKPNTAYTAILKMTRLQSGLLNSNISVHYTDGTGSAIYINSTSETDVYTVVFTTNSAKSVKDFSLGWGGGRTYLYYNESGIFEGTVTASDFKPYVGNTYPISWQSEAGTVYGCNIDPVSGVLKVDLLAINASSISWIKPSTQNNTNGTIFTCDNVTVPFIGWASVDFSKTLSNAFVHAERNANTAGSANNTFWWNNASTGYRVIWGSPSGASSYDDFIAFLTNNNVVFVGELATPLEYTLDPTQIATLLGTNNFWSNSNGSIDLEYRADTKLYIEQLTKPTEDDMVANSNITSGSFFMVGNRLFLSTTAIAQGEQITVGTNCSEVSLADALNQINA